MKLAFGFLLGSILTFGAIVTVFIQTTQHYRSTLFEFDRVRIVKLKGVLP